VLFLAYWRAIFTDFRIYCTAVRMTELITDANDTLFSVQLYRLTEKGLGILMVILLQSFSRLTQ